MLRAVTHRCSRSPYSLLCLRLAVERRQARGCPRYFSSTSIYQNTGMDKKDAALTSAMNSISLAESGVSPLLDGVDTETLHPITLLDKTHVNHDTSVFRFALQSPLQTLGVPVGQHVGLQERIKNDDVLRWYTPLSCEADRGTLELLIKVYGCCPEHPEGGILTQHLEHMQKGDTINVRGPRGKLQYLGRGHFVITEKDSPSRDVHVKRVNMVAGGSGLAPMLQLLRAKARDAEDKLETCLLFANQKEDDIMMREELETLHKQGVLNKLWYTVDTAPPDWEFSTGYVTAEMLKEHLFASSNHTLTVMCGRKAMVRGLVRPLLLELGHDDTLIFKY